MNKTAHKYKVNDRYDYNQRQLNTLHNKIDEIRSSYKTAVVVRIDLFKVKHDPNLINNMFDKLNSNKKFNSNLIFWFYCCEYKEQAGEHYHFAFVFDRDTKFNTPAERQKYSLQPYNAGHLTRTLMREYFLKHGITADTKLIEDQDVANYTHNGIGIWHTNDDQKTNSVSYALSYLCKTVNCITGINQKDNVTVKRKVNFSKVYIHRTSRPGNDALAA